MAVPLLHAVSREHGLCPAATECAKGIAQPEGVHESGDCSVLGTTADYLAAVYPTAAQRIRGMTAERTDAFFRSLHFYYDPGCDLVGSCGEPGAVLRYLYGSLLPCTMYPAQPPASLPTDPVNACLLRHMHFDAAWAEKLPRWLEVEHRAYGLGLPSPTLPFMGKRAPQVASNFMDAGAAGMWYIFRRGSGIFYDAGRTKVAAGKNAMMVSLLLEVEAASPLERTWRTFVAREKLMARSAGAAADAEVIRQTATGSRTCAAAGLHACRCKYILGDQWDNVMVWLARRLGYETLFFTATLLPIQGCVHHELRNGTRHVVEDADIYFTTAYPELVDVRPLNDEMTREQEAGGHRWLVKDARAFSGPSLFTLRKKRNVAERWLKSIREAERLTLRDPFSLEDATRARLCGFNASSRMLQCASHISSQWPHSRFKRDGMVMCGQGGVWLRGSPPPPVPLLRQSPPPPHLRRTLPSALHEHSPLPTQGRRLTSTPHALSSDKGRRMVASRLDVSETIASQVREYLQAVYPAAAVDLHPLETLLALFDSLHFYYTLPDGPNVSGPLLERARSLSSRDRGHVLPLGSAHSCLQPPAGLALLRDRYAELLPCPTTSGRSIGGRGGCLERQYSFDSAWTRGLSSESWVEVQHAAYGNKAAAAYNATRVGWSEFVDPGVAAMWYHYARGSGIFYRLGRTLATSSKMSAWERLLREASDEWASPAARTLRVLSRSDKRFCPRNPDLCRSRTKLADRIRAVANGSFTCGKAGLGYCRDAYDLGDEWDTPMIWLARALGYDTLFFTASICCSSFAERICGISELVDLRVPDAVGENQSRLHDALAKVNALGGQYKTEWLAGKWVDEIQRRGLLALRDPFDLDGDARSKPCIFQPNYWLGCQGHPSEKLVGASPTR
ncbi:hypothetical protein AB1Y20_001614 [Prymnesium parvum]|uniref:Uncharacterized protein n=1 Tax=Prymnesium parvum TaxID=97485 RepID=A0AB34K8P7_PRYPA